MVLVFIFLILLFLLRYPIIKWIDKLPNPPMEEVGRCEVLEEGLLDIGLVYLSPGYTSDSTFVSFSTNLPTNNFISVQYGPDGRMEFETFSLSADIGGHEHFQYKHSASLIIRSFPIRYFYRITCNDKSSKTYSFVPWKRRNNWSPEIAVVAGKITKPLVQYLSTSHRKPSIIVNMAEASSNQNYMYASLEPLVTGIPFLPIPSLNSTLAPLPQTSAFQHMKIGPVYVAVFNKRTVGSLDLREDLALLQRRRAECPWLVLMSDHLPVCASDDTPWGKTPGCRALTDLLVEFKVDMFIVGGQNGYQISRLVATDSQFGSEGSLSSFIVGLQTEGVSIHSLPISPKVFKEHPPALVTLLNLHIEHSDSLCFDVHKLNHSVLLDHTCIKKRASVLSTEFNGLNVTYDKRVWLVLVVTLSLVMLLLLVFRRYFWLRICKFLNSDGSLPLYHENMLAV
ncbi:uncharacterized protein [Watersipora subatra]|uniref:uncharacterized protein n=1 Tax=Watersipora subatra TaxID=2589382 RepID=UPI00355B7F55